MRNREFAVGASGPSRSTQLSVRTRPHAPMAARKRWLLQLAARQRRRGQRRPKRPSQIFWGGAAAPGSLRLPPGTAGPWKWQKKHIQQSTSERQRVGAAETWGGGMEVAPYGPGRNLVGAAASGCQKLPHPSLLGKRKTVKAQATISRRERTFGSPRDRAGGHGSDPYALFLTLAGWWRRPASGCRTALRGAKKH